MNAPRVFIYDHYTDKDKYKNYIAALRASGMECVLSGDAGTSASCGALLLMGGGDMDPSLFGEENRGSRFISRRRDDAEIELVRLFVSRKAPILGICRGLQVLNVFFGGGLIQDIPTAAAHKGYYDAGGVNCDRVHDIRASGFLSELYGPRFAVNSSHHQAAGRVGAELTVAARADDGVVEALIHDSLPIIAVQWHPERMTGERRRDDTVDGAEVFSYFRKLCEENSYGEQSAGSKS